tara:strand:+ start:932 stop:1594 length:663 start_codon:yes stop_codon:yes gene_type:complete
MSFAIVAAVAAPLIIGGITKVINQNKADAMEGDIQASQGVINDLLDNREDVYDASGKIRDMKSMVKNPYENLGVATQAAEMQAAQTDQALANTLDTVQATGMGAGGATALAMAAAQSKKGIAASIEQQESQNEKLKAQGAAQANQQLMNLESQAISAEERAAQGEDARVQAQIDRAYGESDFLRSRQMGIEDAGDAALMAGVSGATSVLSASAGTGFQAG